MKIVTVKRRSLFRDRDSYALFRDEREIGTLDDIGDGEKMEIEIEGRSWRVDRTRTGINESRLRNFLMRNSTGEYRLVDGAGAELATARQPELFQFQIYMGAMTLDVPRQALAKLNVLNERGDVVGALTHGPWKFSRPRDWSSSFTITLEPSVEALFLWLCVMCDRRQENNSPTS